MEVLSDEWFARLEGLLRTAPLAQSSSAVGIGQLVLGAPAGDVAYTIVLGGDAPARLERGTLDHAAVTLVEDYATARAIASGASVAEALGEGRIKVRGDANALSAAYELLAGLAPVLSAAAG